MTKVQQSTELDTFQTRVKIYEDFCQSLASQICLAQEIQTAGKSIIVQIDRAKTQENADIEKLLKQYQGSLGSIEKAIRLENSCRKELFDLVHHKPKET